MIAEFEQIQDDWEDGWTGVLTNEELLEWRQRLDVILSPDGEFEEEVVKSIRDWFRQKGLGPNSLTGSEENVRASAQVTYVVWRNQVIEELSRRFGSKTEIVQ